MSKLVDVIVFILQPPSPQTVYLALMMQLADVLVLTMLFCVLTVELWSKTEDETVTRQAGLNQVETRAHEGTHTYWEVYRTDLFPDGWEHNGCTITHPTLTTITRCSETFQLLECGQTVATRSPRRMKLQEFETVEWYLSSLSISVSSA